MMRSAILVTGLLISITALGTASGVGLKDLPVSAKERDTVSGREIYVNTCIRCHGIDGKGAMGMQFVPPPADLTSDAVQNRLDATLFKRIHDGKANTAMGAWKYALSDDEIWDVLAYIRTLKKQ
jgi:mono/diheme cytochrome c family protein